VGGKRSSLDKEGRCPKRLGRNGCPLGWIRQGEDAVLEKSEKEEKRKKKSTGGEVEFG